MNLGLPLPIMAFATKEGLDRSSFNTIRLGQGWAKKLSPGNPVVLAHKDQVIGLAVVERAERGRLHDIVGAHWRENHSGMVQDQMLEALVKTYGPHRITDTSWLSVVYLKPMQGEHILTL